MRTNQKQTEVAVEFPQFGETIRSPQYTLRIAAPTEAEKVEVSVDGGEFAPARRDSGRWWFDWTNYGTGYHTATARARFRDGYTYTLPPVEMQVELGEKGKRNGKQTLTQLSVGVANEPGALARVTQILSKEGVDLAGVATERFGGSAAIRFLTRREDGLREKLESAGLPVLENEVFHLEIPNRPADFNRLARVLAEESINIVNLYSTTHGQKARCVVTVDQPEAAAGVLSRHGIEILEGQD